MGVGSVVGLCLGTEVCSEGRGRFAGRLLMHSVKAQRHSIVAYLEVQKAPHHKLARIGAGHCGRLARSQQADCPDERHLGPGAGRGRQVR